MQEAAVTRCPAYHPCVGDSTNGPPAKSGKWRSRANNLRYCNVENGFSTVEEFNTKIGSSLDMAKRMSQPQEEEDEPLFGTHIRQAATTIRKIFAR